MNKNKNKNKKVMNNKISKTKVIYSKNKNKILQISKNKDSESISFIIAHLCLIAIDIIKKNQDKQEIT